MRTTVRLLGVVLLLPLLPASVGYSAPTIRGDPQAAREVQAAIRKFSATRSWRARMDSHNDEPLIVEYVAPNRFHVRDPGDPQGGLFVVGLELWERSSGECTKFEEPISRGPQIVMALVLYSKEIIVRDLGEAEGVFARITVHPGAAEMVGSTPTQSYALVVESGGETIREKLYVTTATGLPRRIETRFLGTPVTIDYFDFNAPIAINDPPC